jgi:glucose-1-phosphate thymidylyltransferase
VAIVGIIPAAGYATRLQPIPCSKETYPVNGRPVMDYLLERMRAAPCSEVRVVTRAEKLDVVQHAREEGALVVEARPPSLGASLVAGMSGLSDEDTVLIGFPDSIWEPVDGYRHLLELLGQGWKVALGLFRARLKDMTRHEPVIVEESGRVTRIEFKPERPSSDWMWGCAAGSVRIMRGLAGEEEPGVYFDSLCGQGLVGGVRLSERYLDVGTQEALREALGAEPG